VKNESSDDQEDHNINKERKSHKKKRITKSVKVKIRGDLIKKKKSPLQRG
jgi:hypothetical protein